MPVPFARIYRVEGLAIALLAIHHSESLDIDVGESLRHRVYDAISSYIQDSEQVRQDLVYTARLGWIWGHNELAEAVEARQKR